MIFNVTEELRKDLETARAHHAHTTIRSKSEGLNIEQYVTLGKLSEYQRGRADGLRLALDVIAKHMRSETKNGEDVYVRS